ncbi:FAD-linked oxidase-like protein [Filobasidium floriforme]|uniref:FAD-linked oxidase-like protein n=1 Tax=Filobasidium floriforme TaxID=5210 RepID=UPI001E8CDF5D|nr:FAD-linked oxidase-like protein [Filobasidium floriforme]KAH8080004.1 FAD-linked oxidase-like protein [Filobasidium floriforme]
MWSTRTHIPVPISSVLRRSTQSPLLGRPPRLPQQSQSRSQLYQHQHQHFSFTRNLTSRARVSPDASFFASNSGPIDKLDKAASRSKGLLALAVALVIGTTMTATAYSYTTTTISIPPVNVVYADTDSTAVGHYSDASTSTSKTSTSETSELSKDDQYPDAHRYASPSTRLKAIADLRLLFPSHPNPTTGTIESQLSVNKDELLSHAQAGGTHHHPHTPDVVVYVESTEDVQKCVRWAGEWGVPVVPYSGGTSLEGHITAPYGGLCIDLSRMDKILELNLEDSDMVVQSGVPWEEINSHLASLSHPLFFPLDPGPGATIGGMIGTGCSGTNACRYGTARGEWVLNVTAVLADGEVIKTRQRARKSSAGFDLTKMFVGAEGTLGIITEATIRLAPLLPTTVAIAGFPSVEHAVKAVGEVINSGVPIQCVELCDTLTMKALRDHGGLTLELPHQDSIFFKFQGNPQAMKEAQELTKAIAKKHGGGEMIFAKDEEESKELWSIRKNAHWSMLALVEGGQAYSTDVCVPVSKLPQLCAETQADLKANGIVGPLLGHVGDGNFHCGLIFLPQDFKKVDEAAHRMVDRAIALGGTCTGEHGVGVGKKGYLRRELGDGTVEVMKRLKRAMDPKGILNPGKLYPD